MTAARILAGLALSSALLGCAAPPPPAASASAPGIALPAPELPAQGLAELLAERTSTRDFAADPLSLDDLATLLWAAYGVQGDGGRTVPSAGALYPLTIYVVVGAVTGLDPGTYAYAPNTHELNWHQTGDLRTALQAAALDQAAIGGAPATIVVAGAPDRLRERYRDRSEQFTTLEAGHVGHNVTLAATALGLGAVTIGAFDDAAVARELALPGDETAYYLIPVGRPG